MEDTDELWVYGMESITFNPEEKNVKAVVRWTSHSVQFARNKTMSAEENVLEGRHSPDAHTDRPYVKI